MKLNYLVTTILAIALAFYGFSEIRKSIVNSVNGTVEKIQKAGK